MGLTQEVVDAVTERAGGVPVSRVVVEIGALSGVVPDAFRLYFEMCGENTPLAGAELDIVEAPGRAQCRTCGLESDVTSTLDLCACGSADLEWTSGRVLRVLQIDLEGEDFAAAPSIVKDER